MPRRGENIYRRKDGRWEARYIKRHDERGRAIYGYIYKNSYNEVKKAQAEARVQIKLPPKSTIDYSKNLEEHLVLWLGSIKESIKESTFANYHGIIYRHIIPQLGKLPLNQVNSNLIQHYLNELSANGSLQKDGGLSAKTVRDIALLLQHSLKSEGILLELKLPKYVPPKLRVLTDEEESKLITTAIHDNTPMGLGILISLFTGIRIGELCSLKWEDISIQDCLIQINKTIQRIQNCNDFSKEKTIVEIGTPKSQHSFRDIPIPEEFIKVLKRLKLEKTDNDYVLSGGKKYIEPRLCQYHFKKIIKNAGIADCNFHVLRHTFATKCVELGIDVKTISILLGHSNVNMTLNRYVHPAVDYQRNCIQQLIESSAEKIDINDDNIILGVEPSGLLH